MSEGDSRSLAWCCKPLSYRVRLASVLSVITHAPFAALLPGIFLSETILIVGGLPVMRAVRTVVQPIRLRLAGTRRQAA